MGEKTAIRAAGKRRSGDLKKRGSQGRSRQPLYLSAIVRNLANYGEAVTYRFGKGRGGRRGENKESQFPEVDRLPFKEFSLADLESFRQLTS